MAEAAARESAFGWITPRLPPPSAQRVRDLSSNGALYSDWLRSGRRLEEFLQGTAHAEAPQRQPPP